jgi:hypothetical protein
VKGTCSAYGTCPLTAIPSGEGVGAAVRQGTLHSFYYYNSPSPTYPPTGLGPLHSTTVIRLHLPTYLPTGLGPLHSTTTIRLHLPTYLPTGLGPLQALPPREPADPRHGEARLGLRVLQHREQALGGRGVGRRRRIIVVEWPAPRAGPARSRAGWAGRQAEAGRAQSHASVSQ